MANKVILVGRLTRDPDTKYSANGTAVTNFSIAISEKYFDKKEQKKKEITEFVNCVSFGKTAELISQYVFKGHRIFIEGKLQTSKYEKEGQTHYQTKVVTSTIEFLESRKDQKPKESQQDFGHVKVEKVDPNLFTSDDIPF